jgi:hypothetical protein
VKKTVVRIIVVATVLAVGAVALGLAISPDRFIQEAGEVYAGDVALAIAGVLVGALITILLGGKRPKALKARGALAALLVIAVALLLSVPLTRTALKEREIRLTPTPFEVEIAMMASAKGAAEQYMNVLYHPDPKWRVAFRARPDAESLMAEGQPLSGGELQAILGAAAITPTRVLTDPVACLAYLRTAQLYVVQIRGDRAYLGSTVISPTTQLEAFRLPPITISDGDMTTVDSARTIFVVVHRIPTRPEWGEIGRDLYVVAGLIFGE